ncbi:transposase [Pseudomonas nicosulfuronedens]|uniref:Transposase n=1 Tax=Pseudomonas nicosulfuronedens TaxID=2571105 RepID=A0A5R9QLQ1_9PSED|nr:transposase [Pseudomonas nicosulfuronedens]MDH1011702.1 transposase [Pseudomonas nicosulfuronedens]MDH1980492.1 transposase [Pseudomonas nicosulfuronedens]MDH2027442.1 transposase [Pseudomonas nicosulfuronedens]TLX70462.1 transposase [Pseudomonas nicosulfuronedens]
MPRVGRVILPNYPHHIVQRGHNRQAVFVEQEDYERYLSDLQELKDAFGVKVYAYCLMTNHVHLLLAPDESVAGLSQLMKTLSERMTRYRNRLEGRSGTLWECRFKSSVVQSDAYLLACSRYIELNPVRAKLVCHAAEYPWSSYTQHVGIASRWLDVDPCFDALGGSDEERHERYRGFLNQAASDGEAQLIREALQRGQLTGNARFVEEIERIAGVRIERRGQGRPRLTQEE